MRWLGGGNTQTEPLEDKNGSKRTLAGSGNYSQSDLDLGLFVAAEELTAPSREGTELEGVFTVFRRAEKFLRAHTRKVKAGNWGFPAFD